MLYTIVLAASLEHEDHILSTNPTQVWIITIYIRNAIAKANYDQIEF